MPQRSFWSVLFIFLFSSAAFAQTPAADAFTWVVDIGSRYYILPNVAYAGANNSAAKLDVYVPRESSATAPVPTVIYIHGGGWERNGYFPDRPDYKGRAGALELIKSA